MIRFIILKSFHCSINNRLCRGIWEVKEPLRRLCNNTGRETGWLCMWKGETERLQYEVLGIYFVILGIFIVFYKNGYKNISHSICFSRTLSMPHQEVISMSCPLETGWAFVTALTIKM